MKKSATNLLFILFVILGLIGNTFAQAPEGITYQAEARDENGIPIRNQTLDVLIKIIQDDASGLVVWEGLHEVTTSNFGIFALVIGHGTNISGYFFEDINWGNHLHFLNVQVKTKNNPTWIDMGTTQLLSVPYALHSKMAGEALTADYNNLSNSPVNVSEFFNDAGYITSEEDADPTNELQTLSITYHELKISDGNTISLPDNVDDADPDPGNELITDIILNGSVLEITEASVLKSVDLGSLSGDVNLAELENRVAQLEAIDHDGDGFTISEGDCNDADPSIYPGAPEICGDGIDQDCDGNDLSCVITEVVDVHNPQTGKIWMDRNLGASRAATSKTDAEAYGDLYQWGRGTDGHEKRTSGITNTLSSSDTPGHGDFIFFENVFDIYSTIDWRYPQNDNLWQGVNGTNNPCPDGYRLPTEAEWEAEHASWSSNDAAGAFTSPLKLPVAGYRDSYYGYLLTVGSAGYYWSSTVEGKYSRILNSSSASMGSTQRARGFSVRCFKD